MTSNARAYFYFAIFQFLLCGFQLISDVRATDSIRPILVPRQINSFSSHCKYEEFKFICRDFSFENVSEVAVFNVKAKAHRGESLNLAEELAFVNSTFAHFPLNLFYTIRAQGLDMRNCSLTKVTWENFIMASHLQILLLSDNKLTSIEEMTFDYAPELQFLFLDNNRIHTLSSESFKGLAKLTYLELSHNRLRELPEHVFDHLSSLQNLRLANNRLRVVDNDLFLKNSHLVTVMLNENNLQHLGEEAFKAQQYLDVLDISHNPQLDILITHLQVQHLKATNCSLCRVDIYGSAVNVNLGSNRIAELYFSHPETLEDLNLHNNGLRQLASLTRATKLKTLILADNPDLRDLPDLGNVDSLQHLDLSNTSLTKVPVAFFAKLPNIRFLNVSCNKLREIDPRSFKYLNKLTHFYIHANDWNCYSLNMLMDFVMSRGDYVVTFTSDDVDANFPGEYVYGIKCMYHLADADSVAAEVNSGSDSVKLVQFQTDSTSDVNSLRNELKVQVQQLEQKFDRVLDTISQLNGRLAKFEHLNETLWQHVAIIT